MAERIYNVPLRKEWLKAPKYKRAKRAMTALRTFLAHHMKVEQHLRTSHVKLGPEINLLVWKHGMKVPPHHVKVTVTKDDKGVVHAELFGAPKIEPKVEKKGFVKKLAEKVTGASAAPKPAAPAAKPAEKPAPAAKPAEATPAAPAAAKPVPHAQKPAEKPADKPTPKLNLKPAK